MSSPSKRRYSFAAGRPGGSFLSVPELVARLSRSPSPTRVLAAPNRIGRLRCSPHSERRRAGVLLRATSNAVTPPPRGAAGCTRRLGRRVAPAPPAPLLGAWRVSSAGETGRSEHAGRTALLLTALYSFYLGALQRDAASGQLFATATSIGPSCQSQQTIRKFDHIPELLLRHYDPGRQCHLFFPW